MAYRMTKIPLQITKNTLRLIYLRFDPENHLYLYCEINEILSQAKLRGHFTTLHRSPIS